MQMLFWLGWVAFEIVGRAVGDLCLLARFAPFLPRTDSYNRSDIQVSLAKSLSSPIPVKQRLDMAVHFS